MNLALSTSWNASDLNSGREIIESIKSLGFSKVELGFNLTKPMVDEIVSLVNDGSIIVVSVHNYCPIPDGLERKQALPDYYSLSSLDEIERKKALDYTKRTIDTAKKLKAGAVVLHIGRVDIEDKTRGLIDLLNEEKLSSAEFNSIKQSIIKERSLRIKPFLEAAIKSLQELSKHAWESKIDLGIENRYYFREIPSFEEIDVILKKFPNSNIFYWHDAGHARVWENLGFHSNVSYLERYSDRLLGIHLHDVLGATDHRAPLTGNIDFTKLIPFLRKDTIKVIEAHRPSSEEEVKRGAQYLEDILKGTKDD